MSMWLTEFSRFPILLSTVSIQVSIVMLLDIVDSLLIIVQRIGGGVFRSSVIA